MRPDVRLRQLDDPSLNELLEVAVTDADPDETMPPMSGNPGWTQARREAFLEFFRPMLGGLEGPRRTLIYAITADGQIAGFIRLSRTTSDDAAETGIWLGRSWRGKGIASAALRELSAIAATHGFSKIVADTSPQNSAALGALRSLGATLRVHAELVIDPAYAPDLDK